VARQAVQGKLSKASCSRQAVKGKLFKASCSRQAVQGKLFKESCQRQVVQGKLSKPSCPSQGKLSKASYPRQGKLSKTWLVVSQSELEAVSQLASQPRQSNQVDSLLESKMQCQEHDNFQQLVSGNWSKLVKVLSKS